MTAVFVSTLINTNVSMLITTANWNSQFSIPGWFCILNNQYPDFTKFWYEDKGISIMTTMMI